MSKFYDHNSRVCVAIESDERIRFTIQEFGEKKKKLQR